MNKELLDFLKKCGWYFLASVDGDAARVRPMGFCAVLKNGRLYFGMGDEKRCCRQIRANPNVEICACSADREWVRIRGRAVFDDSEETMAEIFAGNEFLRKKYTPESGLRFAPFYLENVDADLNRMDGTCIPFQA